TSHPVAVKISCCENSRWQATIQYRYSNYSRRIPSQMQAQRKPLTTYGCACTDTHTCSASA
ncbi:unnamed protein product, partial [Ceratitis capitata]